MAVEKMSQRVRLNVGGQIFETTSRTLLTLRDTRLSNLSPNDLNFDANLGEYFFDRNPRLFPYVLDAYREGELHFPRCVCAPALLRELAWWGVGEEQVAACCWRACSEWEEEKQTLAVIDAAYGGARALLPKVGTKTGMCRQRAQAVWVFLEDPYSSRMARLWSFLYLALLILSTIVISLETMESLRVPMTADLKGVLGDSWNTSNPKIDKYHKTEEHPVLRYINYFCTLFFLIELVVRFVVCPLKLRFFCSFFNIIDMLAVFPVSIFTIINLAYPYFWVRKDLELAYYLVGLSAIFRAVRVLKMVKHNRGLQVIFLAVKASVNELLLLGLLVAIAMLIFSTCAYYTELHQPYQFESIPAGFWWSIVTITTVGYGDVIPVTTAGYVVASVCAVCGILITGLPIPVIANNFRLYYTYANLKTKLEQRSLDKVPNHI